MVLLRKTTNSIIIYTILHLDTVRSETMFNVYAFCLSVSISQLITVEYALRSYHIKDLVNAYRGGKDEMECLASITLQKPIFMYKETLT